MPEPITLDALRTLSDLKRAGVIPSVRPCCGHEHCICENAPHVASLRDHAADPEAYDRAIDSPVRLRVVTAGPPTGPPCDGGMTCPCAACALERSKIGAKGAGRAQFKVRPARERSAA